MTESAAHHDERDFDLLVAGELNMDLILSGPDTFPEPGREHLAERFDRVLGSSSAICAANASRLGLRVAFCGLVGGDETGREVLRRLQHSGVDTSLVQVADNRATGLTVVLRQEEDRCMVTYPGVMEDFNLTHFPRSAWNSARHLHLSSLFLQPGILHDLHEILRRARSAGMSTSVDPQWDPSGRFDVNFGELLGRVDLLMPNEAEFLRLGRFGSLEEGRRRTVSLLRQVDGGGSVVVKRGEAGADVITPGGHYTVPGEPSAGVVDAVGAGDSFNAGLLRSFLSGEALHDCVRFANLAGAASTEAAGGTGAFEDGARLQQLLNRAKP